MAPKRSAHRMIGEEKYAIYESLNTLQSLTNPEHGSQERLAD